MLSHFSRRGYSQRSLLKSAQVLPDVGGDLYYPNVKLLLHGDLVTTATNLVDNSALAATITLTGNTQLSATQYKFGNRAIYMDGAGDYFTSPVSSNYTFGTADFCMEAFFWMASAGVTYVLWDCRGSGGGISGPYLQVASNVLQGGCQTGGSTSNITGATTVTSGAWHHAAWSRISGVNRLFLDGSQQGSSFNNNDSLTCTQLRFGANVSGSQSLNGYMDEVRCTIGNGRYASNFVPPVAPFANGT